jgi:biotin-(acetyl-CoA carboxylase) ligase
MSFLGLSHKQELDNFTVVIAEKQTKGKGRWVPPGRLRR